MSNIDPLIIIGKARDLFNQQKPFKNQQANRGYYDKENQLKLQRKKREKYTQYKHRKNEDILQPLG